MRCLHLAPASEARSVLRAGLRPTRWHLQGQPEPVRGIFCLPLLRDRWTTYQWLRELSQWKRQRVVAVTFRLPDEEPVWVGRFSQPHQLLRATQAAAWIEQNPAGAEMIVDRAVDSRDLLHVREVPQLWGWTSYPEKPPGGELPEKGHPLRQRRLRRLYQDARLMLRQSSSETEMLSALAAMTQAAEIDGSRFSAAPLRHSAVSYWPSVRGTTARLLRLFHRREAAPLLRLLCDDREAWVREEAQRSLRWAFAGCRERP